MRQKTEVIHDQANTSTGSLCHLEHRVFVCCFSRVCEKQKVILFCFEFPTLCHTFGLLSDYL